MAVCHYSARQNMQREFLFLMGRILAVAAERKENEAEWLESMTKKGRRMNMRS